MDLAQWNLRIPDGPGTDPTVRFSQVTGIQRDKEVKEEFWGPDESSGIDRIPVFSGSTVF